MSLPEPTVIATGLAVAGVLAAVHLLGGRLHVLDGLPRSRWLSFAGGISVSYVFVHLLPEVGKLGESIGEAPVGLGFLERHAYLMALFGFVAYYGVEKLAKQRGGEVSGDVFWVHVASFAAYNVAVGYLLFHRETSDLAGLVLFGLAMGTHFLVNDWGLRHHYSDRYHDWGRWVLAASVVTGAVVGLVVPITEAALALIFAFIAGGVVLNVIKEEVPEERESRFWAFTGGAAFYTAILLTI